MKGSMVGVRQLSLFGVWVAFFVVASGLNYEVATPPAASSAILPTATLTTSCAALLGSL